MFKIGSPTEVNNYRPISLLSVMSKVLEKIMPRRLTSFLTQQNFFFKFQFGLEENHSTGMRIPCLLRTYLKRLKIGRKFWVYF